MARRIGAIRLQFGNHHLESKGVECEGEKRQRWLEDAANAPKSCVHLRRVLSERRKGDESDVADSVAELKFLPTRLALAVSAAIRPASNLGDVQQSRTSAESSTLLGISAPLHSDGNRSSIKARHEMKHSAYVSAFSIYRLQPPASH